VHAALGGGDRDVHQGGDVLVRPSLDVVEDERRARLEGKQAQLGEQARHVLVLSGRDVRRQRPPGSRLGTDASLELDRLLERLRVQAPPPVSLQRLVDCDPVEPGERGRLAAEAIEMPPRLHERVLRRLLDVAVIVEEAGEHSPDAPLEDADELGEGVEVALLRPQEQRGFRMGHREDASSLVSVACDGPGGQRIQEIVSILLFAINGSHGETARSMSEYAEGELSGYRRWRVARHLARCEKCQALYRSFLATLESLRGLGREEPPSDPDFASQVLKRVREEGRNDPR
jgi:hypothetical protein